jgi:Co/Zn/Cd efflux system component
LLVNLSVAVLLFAYRNGDSNMRSVWLCTRNDAIGNMAVLLAALGVLGTGAGWPDIIVAAILGMLGLTAARSVITQARRELNTATAPASPRPEAVTTELKRR